MLPVIALVGRPNVGKSTFFNRLTRSRDAIVADFPGLTRDRQYGQGRVGPGPYIVVDTGGFEPVRTEGIVQAMAGQAELAIEEADVVLFLTDARAGLTPQDIRIAQHLRRADRPVVLLVNKAEGLTETAKAEFYELGLGEPHLVSGAHGQGVRDALDLAFSCLPEDFPFDEPEAEEDDDGPRRIKVTLAGRPNAGKSTLISAVSNARPKIADYPFTTLQPNLGVVRIGHEKSFVIADIPGLIEGAAEGAGLGHQFLRHLQRTRLLLHMIDLSPFDENADPVADARALIAELEKYDPKLAQKPRWLVLNKLDLIAGNERDKKVHDLVTRLEWNGPVFEISAYTKTGCTELMEAIYRYFEQLRREKEQAAKTDIAEDVRNIESIDSDDPRFKSIE